MGGQGVKVCFSQEDSSRVHKLVFPVGHIGLNAAMPNSCGLFEEQLPISGTRMSSVSKFPNHIRHV